MLYLDYLSYRENSRNSSMSSHVNPYDTNKGIKIIPADFDNDDRKKKEKCKC
jgi:hypothetical protein